MDSIARLRTRLSGRPPRIALPEATDPRVVAAAGRAQGEGLCRPILIGERKSIVSALATANLEPSAFEVIDPATHPRRDQLTAELTRRLNGRAERATTLAAQATFYAGLLVASGELDGAVMGAEVTTTETVRVALQTIGLAPGLTLLSSCFLMALPGGTELIYSDAGVVPDPSPDQLAEIAIAAAASCRLLARLRGARWVDRPTC